MADSSVVKLPASSENHFMRCKYCSASDVYPSRSASRFWHRLLFIQRIRCHCCGLLYFQFQLFSRLAKGLVVVGCLEEAAERRIVKIAGRVVGFLVAVATLRWLFVRREIRVEQELLKMETRSARQEDDEAAAA